MSRQRVVGMGTLTSVASLVLQQACSAGLEVQTTVSSDLHSFIPGVGHGFSVLPTLEHLFFFSLLTFTDRHPWVRKRQYHLL